MKINEELYNKWLNEKYAVATRTQEEYDQFMQWLEDNTDYKWSDGDNIFEFNAWKKCKKETCIAMNYTMASGLTYGKEINNKKNGYQIIEFKDLFTQDLRELLKVGYKVEEKIYDGKSVELILSEEQYEIVCSTFDTNLFHEYSSGQINKIYRPKYNGIKSIGKHEWELVWERKEELYQLVYPKGMYYYERVLAYIGGAYIDLSLTKESNKSKAKYSNYNFTQEQINNIPFDTSFFIKRKVYEENK